MYRASLGDRRFGQLYAVSVVDRADRSEEEAHRPISRSRGLYQQRNESHLLQFHSR